MKKIFVLTLSLIVFGFTNSKAQTTATDFTENDCDGVSHHLFAELESGKVIVMIFVMPCSSCIGPALTSYNIVQSFAQSNPGQVLCYLCDDDGVNTCTQINGWATNSGIGTNRTTFSSTHVLMNDYGVDGMPKVVVLGGGSQHLVYFNENDAAAGNSINVHAAVQSALNATGVADVTVNGDAVNIFPNPVANQLTVDLKQTGVKSIEVIDVLGKSVAGFNYKSTDTGVTVDVSQLTNGIYYLRLATDNNAELKKIVVLH